MHAEHEDGDIGEFDEDTASGFDAVDLRKSAIHDNYVGMKLFSELNRFEAVAGFADDLKSGFVFEDAAETAADEGVIVDEEDGEFIRHGVPPVREGLRDERGYHWWGAEKPLENRREVGRVRAWQRGQCRFGLRWGENLCRDLRLRGLAQWNRIANESRLL